MTNLERKTLARRRRVANAHVRMILSTNVGASFRRVALDEMKSRLCGDFQRLFLSLFKCVSQTWPPTRSNLSINRRYLLFSANQKETG